MKKQLLILGMLLAVPVIVEARERRERRARPPVSITIHNNNPKGEFIKAYINGGQQCEQNLLNQGIVQQPIVRIDSNKSGVIEQRCCGTGTSSPCLLFLQKYNKDDQFAGYGVENKKVTGGESFTWDGSKLD